MQDERIQALLMALKAVLVVSKEAGMDPDKLCETAVELMCNDFRCCSNRVPKATIELERAVDALP